MDYTRFEHLRLTPFEQWVQAEGLKVITGHTIVDVLTEELEPWKRTGCQGALLDMTHESSDQVMINNQGTTRYIVEIRGHQHANPLQPLRSSTATIPSTTGSIPTTPKPIRKRR